MSMSTDAISAKCSPPVPKPDPLTAGFWEATAQGKLAIQQCSRCGRFSHPPVRICPKCQSLEFKWTPVSGRGVVSHRTVIPESQSRVQGLDAAGPFAIIIVELVEQTGLYLVANLRGAPPEAAVVGLPVEVVFEKIGGGVVLPQFKPGAGGS